MIGRSMESWPGWALQRAADATAMCAGVWARGDVGCLLTTAFRDAGGAYDELGDPTVARIVGRFDGLVLGGRRTRVPLFNIGTREWDTYRRVPVDTLRVMCANRARRILASRSIAAHEVKATAQSVGEQLEECVR